MTKRVMLVPVLCLMMAGALSSAGAERAWQIGTWREVRVKRPKIVLGIGGNPIGGGPGPRAPAPMMEVRTYVIETDHVRLELRENVRADSRRLDAVPGEAVTFALEKKTVYVKVGGLEHKLRVTRTSAPAGPG
jgi:hypothetical protein